MMDSCSPASAAFLLTSRLLHCVKTFASRFSASSVLLVLRMLGQKVSHSQSREIINMHIVL
jgi:hypothetical protein